ncbi:His-Xaa-Ser system radical SAM maturase HxsC [Rhizobium sp. PP-CC-3A-592]|nr:His-Xaa-Ser system radical SAM maturase HxsC [Rhizobium sp. PP-CC-3A-592]
MINLRVAVEAPPILEPLVVRLLAHEPTIRTDNDAVLLFEEDDRLEYDLQGFSLVVHAPSSNNIDGDVLLIVPGQPSAHRLIRASSKHNTLLVTERCDQLCVMCSQPPKSYHTDLFDQFATAALLAPEKAMIGISGGEPLLYKSRLLEMLGRVVEARPDLTFHILTNGQHLSAADVPAIAELGPERILWGVPIYAVDAAVHDSIVGKSGAFAKLTEGLTVLMRAGASVELRTVVLRQNWDQLPTLADFISSRLSFSSVWAIMQLEPIGYGRMNWRKSFQDTSEDFSNVARAIDISMARGQSVSLYNFPLCSVPHEYQRHAPSTISDWKRKYLDFCDGCSSRQACGGFFEWYKHGEGFARLGGT